jgi:hypothetical protein
MEKEGVGLEGVQQNREMKMCNNGEIDGMNEVVALQ